MTLLSDKQTKVSILVNNDFLLTPTKNSNAIARQIKALILRHTVEEIITRL